VKRDQATAARRYARALLEVAFTRPDGDPGGLRRELEQAAAQLEQSADLQDALDSPALPAESKLRVMGAVWPQSSPLMRRLLEMLVERGRTALLGAIAAAFADLWNAARGVVPAQATSAVPLAPEQQEAITRALGRVTGKDVELSTSVDPELLGGLQVRMAGQVYDGTVRGRLRALRAHLASGD
jgi:F-type H+-transporting ATPase subunit delta